VTTSGDVGQVQYLQLTHDDVVDEHGRTILLQQVRNLKRLIQNIFKS
jgi:hypothetical protein